jgi:hypothetical protein
LLLEFTPAPSPWLSIIDMMMDTVCLYPMNNIGYQARCEVSPVVRLQAEQYELVVPTRHISVGMGVPISEI